MSDQEPKNINELRDKFLLEAEKVLNHNLALAVGDISSLPLSRMDESRHAAILIDVMEMVKVTDARHNVQAASVKDITKAMATGKITAKEAIDFMQVVKLAAEAESIANGGTAANVTIPSLVVNLASPQSSAEEVKKEEDANDVD